MTFLNLTAHAVLAIAGATFALGTAAQEQTLAAADPAPLTLATAGEAFATPVDADTLATYRGGAQTHNDMTLDGVTAGNVARNVATGDNSIASGSFADMNGLPIVIQNSGANVLIQNAVILNLQMN